MKIRQTAKRELTIETILSFQRKILTQLDDIQLVITLTESCNISNQLGKETRQPMKMAEADIGEIGGN